MKKFVFFFPFAFSIFLSSSRSFASQQWSPQPSGGNVQEELFNNANSIISLPGSSQTTTNANTFLVTLVSATGQEYTVHSAELIHIAQFSSTIGHLVDDMLSVLGSDDFAIPLEVSNFTIEVLLNLMRDASNYSRYLLSIQNQQYSDSELQQLINGAEFLDCALLKTLVEEAGVTKNMTREIGMSETSLTQNILNGETQVSSATQEIEISRLLSYCRNSQYKLRNKRGVFRRNFYWNEFRFRILARLRAGDNPNLPVSSEFPTPLVHIALYFEDLELMGALMDSGADLDVMDSYNFQYPVFGNAILGGRLEVLAFLARRGVNMNQLSRFRDPFDLNQFLYINPLSIAILSGRNLAAAILLLHFGTVYTQRDITCREESGRIADTWLIDLLDAYRIADEKERKRLLVFYANLLASRDDLLRLMK